MAWPDYTKPGETESARDMLNDIIRTARLNATPSGDASTDWDLILGAALYSRELRRHGLSGATNTWNTAPRPVSMWDNIRAAWNGIQAPTPDTAQILTDIDHGGAG